VGITFLKISQYPHIMNKINDIPPGMIKKYKQMHALYNALM